MALMTGIVNKLIRLQFFLYNWNKEVQFGLLCVLYSGKCCKVFWVCQRFLKTSRIGTPKLDCQFNIILLALFAGYCSNQICIIKVLIHPLPLKTLQDLLDLWIWLISELILRGCLVKEWLGSSPRLRCNPIAKPLNVRGSCFTTPSYEKKGKDLLLLLLSNCTIPVNSRSPYVITSNRMKAIKRLITHHHFHFDLYRQFDSNPNQLLNSRRPLTTMKILVCWLLLSGLLSSISRSQTPRRPFHLISRISHQHWMNCLSLRKDASARTLQRMENAKPSSSRSWSSTSLKSPRDIGNTIGELLLRRHLHRVIKEAIQQYEEFKNWRSHRASDPNIIIFSFCNGLISRFFFQSIFFLVYIIVLLVVSVKNKLSFLRSIPTSTRSL